MKKVSFEESLPLPKECPTKTRHSSITSEQERGERSKLMKFFGKIKTSRRKKEYQVNEVNDDDEFDDDDIVENNNNDNNSFARLREFSLNLSFR